MNALMLLAAHTQLRHRLQSESGQTAVEWLGIAVVIIAIVVAVAGQADVIAPVVSQAFNTLINRVVE
ncbi:MAG TPA: hypothetical protein VMM13_18525 [Euzebya sp.]|nr:hypothetical protein [Euzebya sp.]